MKKLALILLFIIGCHPNQPAYTPVNWNAPSEPPQPKAFLPEPPPQQPTDDLQQLLDLHNQQRTLKGSPPLTIDQSLIQYAQTHAEWMAQNNNLKHSNIDNVIPLGNFMTAGENIAWNQQNPQEVVNAWMHSPGHRANILNKRFSKVGFGVKDDGHGPFWCTVFGG